MTPVTVKEIEATKNFLSTKSQVPTPLWTPSPDSILQSQLTDFIGYINQKYSNLNLVNYRQLYDWSIREIVSFWREIWDFCGIQGSRAGMDPVLGEYRYMDEFPKWFEGRKLNFAKNLLFPHDLNGTDRVHPDGIALHFRSEIPELSRSLTWQELRNQVSKAQSLLKDKFGIIKGDRIGAYAPNCPEVLIYMLAGASIGAIFTAGSPDFGPTVNKYTHMCVYLENE